MSSSWKDSWKDDRKAPDIQDFTKRDYTKTAATIEREKRETRFYFGLLRSKKGIRKTPPPTEAELYDGSESEQSEAANFKIWANTKVERSGGDPLNVIDPVQLFSEISTLVPSFLRQNVARLHYERLTPIQSHAIPVALQGHDMMSCAQTGSGKTFAFLLPTVTAVAALRPFGSVDDTAVTTAVSAARKRRFRGRKAAPVALVLAPTRELAQQIHREAQRLTHGVELRAVAVYGGAKPRAQLLELAQGVDILVATPGRLQDFWSRQMVTLAAVRVLVVDEADRMLDMGFQFQLKQLIAAMPSSSSSGADGRGGESWRRQTLMFSATFPAAVQTLAAEFMSQYTWLRATNGSSGRAGNSAPGRGWANNISASISQRVLRTAGDADQKLKLLVDVLDGGRTLIFVRLKKTARWLAVALRKQAHKAHADSDRRVPFAAADVVEIDGDRKQAQREAALRRFRSAPAAVLVATDVAARGLDVLGVRHVVNWSLPTAPAEFAALYTHRIGRTGRMGREGIATSFYVPGYDEESGGCAAVAPLLLLALRGGRQRVPKWFQALPETRAPAPTIATMDVAPPLFSPPGKRVEISRNDVASNRQSKRPAAVAAAQAGGKAGEGAQRPKKKRKKKKRRKPSQDVAKAPHTPLFVVPGGW